MLDVNPTAIIWAQENASTIRLVIQSVSRREPPSRANEQRHAREFRDLVPSLRLDPRAFFRRDGNVVLPAARGAAIAIPVLKHGE